MKKITLLFSVVIFALAITSCNKKKIKDLEAEAAANKAALEALQASTATNNTASLTGNPINVSFMGNRGFDSTAYSYSVQYDYGYGEPRWYTYVDEYNDGSGMMSFYIERYNSVDSDYDCYIQIDNFDPTVGINSAEIYVYAENLFAPTDTASNLYIDQNGYLNYGGYNDNITVNSFSYNETTRAFSINLTVNSTEADPQNSSYNPAKVTFSYSGVLSPYYYNGTVYRKAHK
jgi:hypothetical protein